MGESRLQAGLLWSLSFFVLSGFTPLKAPALQEGKTSQGVCNPLSGNVRTWDS